MTVLPSSTPILLRSPIWLCGFLALATVAIPLGCADNHVGRPCEIGVAKTAIDPTKVIVNPAALECPSRLCLLPAQNGSPVGAIAGLCTVECSSDDDCSDGEKGMMSATNTRCTSGFACRTLLPNLSSNGQSCKALCVCKDFLSKDDKAMSTKPQGCP